MKRHICLQLTKIQVFKLYHLFLLLSLAVLLLLSRSPRNTKTRLIRLKHLKIKKKNKMIGNERKQVRCPSCGGTDHSRSSSKLCPMNKSKPKLATRRWKEHQEHHLDEFKYISELPTLKTANLTSFLLAASTSLQNYTRIHNYYCQDKWYVTLLHGIHFNNVVYGIGLKS